MTIATEFTSHPIQLINCVGQISLPGFSLAAIPKYSQFSLNSNSLCGNVPTEVQALSTTNGLNWDVGDNVGLDSSCSDYATTPELSPSMPPTHFPPTFQPTRMPSAPSGPSGSGSEDSSALKIALISVGAVMAALCGACGIYRFVTGSLNFKLEVVGETSNPLESQSGKSQRGDSSVQMAEMGEGSANEDLSTLTNIGEMSYIIPIQDLRRDERPIAAGGGGQVYKGTLRGQPVAIKSIYSQMVEGDIDELEVRFARRTRTSRDAHPYLRVLSKVLHGTTKAHPSTPH